MASDVSRLEILNRFGGVYTDGDNSLVHPDGRGRDLADAVRTAAQHKFGFLASRERDGKINNSALVSAAGVGATREYLRIQQDNFTKDLAETIARATVVETAGINMAAQFTAADREPTWLLNDSSSSTENETLGRTGPTPYIFNQLAAALGIAGNNPRADLPFISDEIVHVNSGHSWLEQAPDAQESAPAPRAHPGREGVLDAVRSAVVTLHREMPNRGGYLHLPGAARTIDKLPEAQRPAAWTAALNLFHRTVPPGTPVHLASKWLHDVPPEVAEQARDLFGADRNTRGDGARARERGLADRGELDALEVEAVRSAFRHGFGRSVSADEARAAFREYLRWMDEHGKERRFPENSTRLGSEVAQLAVTGDPRPQLRGGARDSGGPAAGGWGSGPSRFRGWKRFVPMQRGDREVPASSAAVAVSDFVDPEITIRAKVGRFRWTNLRLGDIAYHVMPGDGSGYGVSFAQDDPYYLTGRYYDTLNTLPGESPHEAAVHRTRPSAQRTQSDVRVFSYAATDRGRYEIFRRDGSSVRVDAAGYGEILANFRPMRTLSQAMFDSPGVKLLSATPDVRSTARVLHRSGVPLVVEAPVGGSATQLADGPFSTPGNLGWQEHTPHGQVHTHSVYSDGNVDNIRFFERFLPGAPEILDANRPLTGHLDDGTPFEFYPHELRDTELNSNGTGWTRTVGNSYKSSEESSAERYRGGLADELHHVVRTRKGERSKLDDEVSDLDRHDPYHRLVPAPFAPTTVTLSNPRTGAPQQVTAGPNILSAHGTEETVIIHVERGGQRYKLSVDGRTFTRLSLQRRNFHRMVAANPAGKLLYSMCSVAKNTSTGFADEQPGGVFFRSSVREFHDFTFTNTAYAPRDMLWIPRLYAEDNAGWASSYVKDGRQFIEVHESTRYTGQEPGNPDGGAAVAEPVAPAVDADLRSWLGSFDQHTSEFVRSSLSAALGRAVSAAEMSAALEGYAAWLTRNRHRHAVPENLLRLASEMAQWMQTGGTSGLRGAGRRFGRPAGAGRVPAGAESSSAQGAPPAGSGGARRSTRAAASRPDPDFDPQPGPSRSADADDRYPENLALRFERGALSPDSEMRLRGRTAAFLEQIAQRPAEALAQQPAMEVVVNGRRVSEALLAQRRGTAQELIESVVGAVPGWSAQPESHGAVSRIVLTGPAGAHGVVELSSQARVKLGDTLVGARVRVSGVAKPDVPGEGGAGHSVQSAATDGEDRYAEQLGVRFTPGRSSSGQNLLPVEEERRLRHRMAGFLEQAGQQPPGRQLAMQAVLSSVSVGEALLARRHSVVQELFESVVDADPAWSRESSFDGRRGVTKIVLTGPAGAGGVVELSHQKNPRVGTTSVGMRVRVSGVEQARAAPAAGDSVAGSAARPGAAGGGTRYAEDLGVRLAVGNKSSGRFPFSADDEQRLRDRVGGFLEQVEQQPPEQEPAMAVVLAAHNVSDASLGRRRAAAQELIESVTGAVPGWSAESSLDSRGAVSRIVLTAPSGARGVVEFSQQPRVIINKIPVAIRVRVSAGAAPDVPVDGGAAAPDPAAAATGIAEPAGEAGPDAMDWVPEGADRGWSWSDSAPPELFDAGDFDPAAVLPPPLLPQWESAGVPAASDAWEPSWFGAAEAVEVQGEPRAEESGVPESVRQAVEADAEPSSSTQWAPEGAVADAQDSGVPAESVRDAGQGAPRVHGAFVGSAEALEFDRELLREWVRSGGAESLAARFRSAVAEQRARGIPAAAFEWPQLWLESIEPRGLDSARLTGQLRTALEEAAGVALPEEAVELTRVLRRSREPSGPGAAAAAPAERRFALAAGTAPAERFVRAVEDLGANLSLDYVGNGRTELESVFRRRLYRRLAAFVREAQRDPELRLPIRVAAAYPGTRAKRVAAAQEQVRAGIALALRLDPADDRVEALLNRVDVAGRAKVDVTVADLDGAPRRRGHGSAMLIGAAIGAAERGNAGAGEWARVVDADDGSHRVHGAFVRSADALEFDAESLREWVRSGGSESLVARFRSAVAEQRARGVSAAAYEWPQLRLELVDPRGLDFARLTGPLRTALEEAIGGRLPEEAVELLRQQRRESAFSVVSGSLVRRRFAVAVENAAAERYLRAVEQIDKGLVLGYVGNNRAELESVFRRRLYRRLAAFVREAQGDPELRLPVGVVSTNLELRAKRAAAAREQARAGIALALGLDPADDRVGALLNRVDVTEHAGLEITAAEPDGAPRRRRHQSAMVIGPSIGGGSYSGGPTVQAAAAGPGARRTGAPLPADTAAAPESWVGEFSEFLDTVRRAVARNDPGSVGLISQHGGPLSAWLRAAADKQAEAHRDGTEPIDLRVHLSRSAVSAGGGRVLAHHVREAIAASLPAGAVLPEPLFTEITTAVHDLRRPLGVADRDTVLVELVETPGLAERDYRNVERRLDLKFLPARARLPEAARRRLRWRLAGFVDAAADAPRMRLPIEIAATARQGRARTDAVRQEVRETFKQWLHSPDGRSWMRSKGILSLDRAVERWSGRVSIEQIDRRGTGVPVGGMRVAPVYEVPLVGSAPAEALPAGRFTVPGREPEASPVLSWLFSAGDPSADFAHTLLAMVREAESAGREWPDVRVIADRNGGRNLGQVWDSLAEKLRAAVERAAGEEPASHVPYTRLYMHGGVDRIEVHPGPGWSAEQYRTAAALDLSFIRRTPTMSMAMLQRFAWRAHGFLDQLARRDADEPGPVPTMRIVARVSSGDRWYYVWEMLEEVLRHRVADSLWQRSDVEVLDGNRESRISLTAPSGALGVISLVRESTYPNLVRVEVSGLGAEPVPAEAADSPDAGGAWPQADPWALQDGFDVPAIPDEIPELPPEVLDDLQSVLASADWMGTLTAADPSGALPESLIDPALLEQSAADLELPELPAELAWPQAPSGGLGTELPSAVDEQPADLRRDESGAAGVAERPQSVDVPEADRMELDSDGADSLFSDGRPLDEFVDYDGDAVPGESSPGDRVRLRADAAAAVDVLGKRRPEEFDALLRDAGQLVAQVHEVPGLADVREATPQQRAEREFFEDVARVVARELHARGPRAAAGLARELAAEFGTARRS
ncbi:MAG: hypothetical protein IJH84_11910 [Saccharopolyspora sp.]|uniref:hypothetical protein n=1 Tax=Saccharopolyspora sp. TaxID=33915 RepID=UPI0025FFD612|nr:hypothetical protein [Saccharopolyspora sp.]MBQ6641723.1 hypothetical protein [Saccharopolyspora sp.]